MAGQKKTLSFCWWNLHDFAHYDAGQLSDPRWPRNPADYETKMRRVLAALQEMNAGRFPDLLAVCEITREAAADLASRMKPAFDVTFAPTYPYDDGFQVVVLCRKGIGFTPETILLSAEKLAFSEETRPMVPVHFNRAGEIIRFVACHWTSFDNPRSQAARVRLAEYLRGNTYDFLHPDGSSADPSRHVVVLGDLNVEPADVIFAEFLNAARDHDSGRYRHWRDRNQRRVRLYNSAWRFQGEQVAYRGGVPSPGLAGTYYNGELGWRTFDHLIVSGGLLTAPPPYLDEANTAVRVTATMRSGETPMPFAGGASEGISDHLPIVGRIILRRA
jgi:endonuclease/exonuclease/phosphatase family metal-dependent hydrolase